jgi:hypothetical protein
LQIDTENDLYSGMKSLEAYKKDIRGLGLTDAQATKLYERAEIMEFSGKLDAVEDFSNPELSSKLYETLEGNESKLLKTCQSMILKKNPLSVAKGLLDKSEAEKRAVLKKNGITDELSSDVVNSLYRVYVKIMTDVMQNAIYANNMDILKPLAKKDYVINAAADIARVRTPKKELEEKVLKANPDKGEEFSKAYDTYFAQIEGAKEFDKINKNQLYKKYFKEVYAQRDTLKEAAAFPWREFTDDEMEQLKKKITP